MGSLKTFCQSKSKQHQTCIMMMMVIGVGHLFVLSTEAFTIPSTRSTTPTMPAALHHQKKQQQPFQERRSVTHTTTHTSSSSSSSLFMSSATEELAPGIKAIDELNPGLEEQLDALRLKPYFRLYSVDMLGSCEYIPQELFECYSETCEIYPIEEEDVRIYILYFFMCVCVYVCANIFYVSQHIRMIFNTNSFSHSYPTTFCLVPYF